MPIHGTRITRRDFIKTSAVGTLCLHMPGIASSEESVSPDGSNAIRGIGVGTATAVPDNFGDTWAVSCADDGNLYAPSNDTLGFDIPRYLNDREIHLFQSDFVEFEKRLTEKQKREFRFGPLAFNRIEGSDPHNLTGITVNRMQDYMHQDGFDSLLSGHPRKGLSDKRSWKSSGCTFIDGALYWSVARHKYPNSLSQIGLRQSAANASLLKSTDYGVSWTRSAVQNLQDPMFSGGDFATPYLIDYGRDSPAVDNSDRYVYAVSNNGFWDNGDSMILGRVARQRIGSLRGSDWEFLTGSDGLSDANWSAVVTDARPILSKPGKLGETGAVYLPGRRRYMMIGWYYPAGSGYLRGASKTTVWDFYESPKPWGPWTHIHSHTWLPQGYYCPSICPKFQTADRIYVLTAGDFNNWWDFYRLTVVPIDLA